MKIAKHDLKIKKSPTGLGKQGIIMCIENQLQQVIYIQRTRGKRERNEMRKPLVMLFHKLEYEA